VTLARGSEDGLSINGVFAKFIQRRRQAAAIRIRLAGGAVRGGQSKPRAEARSPEDEICDVLGDLAVLRPHGEGGGTRQSVRSGVEREEDPELAVVLLPTLCPKKSMLAVRPSRSRRATVSSASSRVLPAT
jgi:hypothetical protein